MFVKPKKPPSSIRHKIVFSATPFIFTRHKHKDILKDNVKGEEVRRALFVMTVRVFISNLSSL